MRSGSPSLQVGLNGFGLLLVSCCIVTPVAAVDAVWTLAQDGIWSDASNWSTDAPILIGDSATIDATGAAYTVTINGATAINHVTLNSTDALLRVEGVDFSASNVVNVEQGVFGLSGGRVHDTRFEGTSGGNRLTISLGGVLDNVDLAVDAFAQLMVVRNTLTLDEATFGSAYGHLESGSSISGSGVWQLGLSVPGSPYSSFYIGVPVESGGVFTLGQGVTMRASPYLTIFESEGSSKFINQGEIVADLPDTKLRFELLDNSFGKLHASNSGELRATLTGSAGEIVIDPGGYVSLSGDFHFNQSVTVGEGAHLSLSGVSDRPGGLALQLESGGLLTIPASGKTPAIISAGGTIALNNAYNVAEVLALPITGTAMLEMGPSGSLDLSGNALDYTTLPHPFTFTQLTINNGTLTGPGDTIDLSGVSFSNLVLDVPTRVVGSATIRQQSTLQAPVVVDGGPLTLSDEWDNQGGVVVESGTVVFDDPPTAANGFGTFVFNGGEAKFNYSMSASELLSSPFTLPTTTVLGATLDLEGSTWNAATAPTTLVVDSGRLVNGTVQGDVAQPELHTLELRWNSSLDNVTIDSMRVLKDGGGGVLTDVTLRDVTIESLGQYGLTMRRGVLENSRIDGSIFLNEPITLHGNIEVNGQLGGASSRGSADVANLVLSSGATISGTGVLGNTDGRVQGTVIKIVDPSFTFPAELSLVAATQYDSTSSVQAANTDLTVESAILVGHATPWVGRSDSWTFNVAALSTEGAISVNFDGLLKVEGGPWSHLGEMTLEDALVDANSLFVAESGLVSGDGTIIALGGVEIAGDLRGISPDTILSVDGDFALLTSGTVAIPLGEIDAAASSYRVDVTGSADLLGGLEVLLLDGFAPTAGDSFEILTAATLTGSFSSASLPALNSDLTWNLAYGANSIVLEVISVIHGDFNNDGIVDGTDFLNWQRGESPNPISVADLTAWQANYGASTASIAAVPEPAALVLIALVAAIGLTGRLHGQKNSC